MAQEEKSAVLEADGGFLTLQQTLCSLFVVLHQTKQKQHTLLQPLCDRLNSAAPLTECATREREKTLTKGMLGKKRNKPEAALLGKHYEGC